MMNTQASAAGKGRRVVALLMCSSVVACESGGPTAEELAILIEPAVANVMPGESILFTAEVLNSEDTRISWKVVEGSEGGVITVSGNYLAPEEPGTYHVVATSLANPEEFSTAQIQVQSFALGGTPDGLPPLAPTVELVTPPSPANENSPVVFGSSEESSTVRIYTNSGCNGEAIGIGQASAANGSFSITISVPDNSVTPIFARATDVEDLVSPCSSASFSYEEDSIAPSAPTVLSTSGVSYLTSSLKVNLSSQTVAEGAAITTVTNYLTGPPPGGLPPVYTCHRDQTIDGQVNIATATLCSTISNATFNTSTGNLSWSNVGLNGAHEFLLRGTWDGLNWISQVFHVYVGEAPRANHNGPTVSGAATAGTTVRIYGSSTCTGDVLGADVTSAGGHFNVIALVDDNTITDMFATSVDAAGNESACSSTSRKYVEDSQALPPEMTFSTPNSPANNNNPSIWGTTEPYATVRLYTEVGCAGLVVGTGTASDVGIFSIPVTVLDNTTTPFFGQVTDTLGHVSNCSTNYFVYVEDTAPPALPQVATVYPASPANNNVPYVGGVAEPLVVVEIYSNALCTGAPRNAGDVSAWGTYYIPVFVADNSSNTFYARAVDRSGNTSACSTTFVAYVEDSIPPNAPVLVSINPTSPANNNQPLVTGTAEANSLIRLYGNPSCGGGSIAVGSTSSLGTFSFNVTLADNSINVLYARAFDAAGNGSTCSITSLVYVEDSLAPIVPSMSATSPPSPANNNTPSIIGVGEPLAGISIHDDPQCTSTVLGTGNVNGTGFFSVSIAVLDNTITQLFAKSFDAAGNMSACSLTFISYIEDSIPPLPPTWVSVFPESPANDNTPTVSGASEALSTVTFYTTPNCSGPSVGTGVTDEAGKFAGTATVVDNFNGLFYGTATDLAGNVSICSPTGIPYIEDSLAPTVTFTVPRDGSSVGQSQLTAFAVSGTCSEVPGFVEVVASCDFEVVPCVGGSWSAILDLSTLCPGAVLLTASQEDVAGNVGSDDVKLGYFPNWDQFPYSQQTMAQFASALQVVSSEQTQETSMHGTLSNSTQKWRGGVLAPNGFIYALPFDATAILKINPASPSGPAQIGSFASGGGKWQAGVLAPNQKIYGIPRGSTNILKIDPSNDSISTFGSFAGSNKWAGAVVAPNGAIYALPMESNAVLKVLPADDSATTIGNLAGSWKWTGAVLAPNGVIYGVPFNSTSILKINPADDSLTTFGDFPGTWKWMGAVLAPNGFIYFLPYSSSTILKLDPNTDSVTQFGSIAGGDHKYAYGALGPDGKIYAAPFNAKSVLVIDPETDTISTLPLAGTPDYAYHGMLMAMDGSLYGIPNNATSILRILPPLTSGPPNANFALSRHLNKL